MNSQEITRMVAPQVGSQEVIRMVVPQVGSQEITLMVAPEVGSQAVTLVEAADTPKNLNEFPGPLGLQEPRGLLISLTPP